MNMPSKHAILYFWYDTGLLGEAVVYPYYTLIENYSPTSLGAAACGYGEKYISDLLTG